MTTFDERKNAYESKFAHDQEAQFKLTARRNKLLGYWAAEKLCLKDDEVESYAKEVVMADLEEPGDEDVVRKLTKDFADAGLGIEDHEIREAIHSSADKARQQLLAESNKD